MRDRDRVALEVSRRIHERWALPPPTERRTLRELAGLSAQDLAVVLGVNASTVLRWETGERMPKGRNLTDYLRVLATMRRQVRAPAQDGEG